MINKTKKILSHPLISGSGIIFVGSFAGSVLQFFFNLAMGRLLTEVQYGLLVTLVAMISLLAILQGALSNIFSKYAASYHAREDSAGYSSLVINGFKTIIGIALAFFVVLLIITIPLISFLHITDFSLLFFSYLSIVSIIIFSLPMGLLQGKMRFLLVSLFNFLPALLKIITGILFVILGMQVLGGILGIFISTTVFTIISSYLVLRNISPVDSKKDSHDFFQDFRGYSLRFILATFGLTIISYMDVLFVRHFFNGADTGLYSALSVMGKAIFYFTSPIYFVFFPLIAYKRERKDAIFGTLALTVGIIVAISASLSVFYFLFPHFVINVFYPKPVYQKLSPYLGWFGIYIALFSIVYLFNNYFLSIGKSGVYKINLLFAVLFVLLIFLFHGDFYSVIADLSITSLLLIVAYILYYHFNGN